MKYIKCFLLALVTVSLIQNYSSAQGRFLLGPTVGLTLPSGDYSGTTMDYYNGTSYGLSSGINFGAVVKANLTVINLRFGINYSSLKNTGNSEPGQGSIEHKQNLFMISAGPEYVITIPGSIVRPYFGANLLFTSFSGETSFQGVSRVPSGTYQMSSASRTGLGLGFGVMVAVGLRNMVDIGLSYNLHNLFGKSYSGGDDRIFSYTSLNDDKDPINPNDINKHPIGSSRNISTIQINLSFLFGL